MSGLSITFALGLFFIAGAFITSLYHTGERVEHLSMAIALGTLSGLAVIELAPEALEYGMEGWAPWVEMLVFALLGAGLLKVVDLFIPEHGHREEDVTHESSEVHIGIASSIAITLHNVIEGMTVYSLAEQSLTLGLMAGLGVGLHNIPMGMLIFATLSTARRSRRNAFIAMASLSTLAGGIIMSLLWRYVNDALIGALICLTLGMVAYIVIFELIPHLAQAGEPRPTALGVLAGLSIMLAAAALG